MPLPPALESRGFTEVKSSIGSPQDFRKLVENLQNEGKSLQVIAATEDILKWTIVGSLGDYFPEYSDARFIAPESYLWPDFLKRSNLLAIVDRIVVIAIIAIGMTMVIITGGIDLSVGSLIALSAVVATVSMKAMGGLEAPAWVIPIGFLAGILCCGAVGGFGGFLVHRFRVAPFITTLGVMMMARGMAFMITGGFSIYQVPDGLTWLGQGRTLAVPNTVILLVVLYLAAHIFMSRTRYGRYIYAVGGNEEAARLSGVPIRFVLILVYVVSGLAAGLGGCIQASQLNTGTPKSGVDVRIVCHCRSRSGRNQPIRWQGTDSRHPHRRFYHLRTAKRHEPAGGGKLYPTGHSGRGDTGRSSGRQAAGTIGSSHFLHLHVRLPEVGLDRGRRGRVSGRHGVFHPEGTFLVSGKNRNDLHGLDQSVFQAHRQHDGG